MKYINIKLQKNKKNKKNPQVQIIGPLAHTNDLSKKVQIKKLINSK